MLRCAAVECLDWCAASRRVRLRTDTRRARIQTGEMALAACISGLTNQAHPQPVAAVVERNQKEQMKKNNERAGTPAVGCSALLGIVLIVTLVIVCDVQLFLYPPSYAELRIWYLLTPLGYIAGFVLAFLVKPSRKKGNININRFISDESKREQDSLCNIGAPKTQHAPFNQNSLWSRFNHFIRKIVVPNLNLNGHAMPNDSSSHTATEKSPATPDNPKI